MSILQINNNHFIKGGSDRVYFATAELLRTAGYRVVPFAAQGERWAQETPYARHFPPAADTGSMRPHDLPRFLHNRAAARALEALLDREPDIMLAHLHIYYGRVTASILPVLRRRGIAVVQTLHEYKLACPVYTMERQGRTCELCVSGTTLNALRHRCKDGSLARSAAMLTEFWSSRLQGDVRLIDRFICVSHFQRRLMARAGLPEDKLVTLHNFVDPEDFPAASGPREDYLLFAGRIEVLKGIRTLIETVRRTGHRLIIAGTGAWTEDMRKIIADAPNIDYRGFVSGKALRQLVARARAVVVPSEWYENCPMSVLEAKAAAVPVIGSDIGGIPELVRDGVDGFIFAAGDSVALGGALERLDMADVEALAEAASVDARTRFSPGIHLEQLHDIYNLEGAPP